MNISKLKDAGIDYASGLKRCLEDPEFYERVLRAFINENILEKVKNAFEKKDIQKLKIYVHEAKGASANISLLSVYEIANDLDNILQKPNYTNDELEKAFSIFSEVFSKADIEIKEALKG